MLAIGLVYLGRLSRKARSYDAAPYKAAISHWQQDSSGATSFLNAFGSASAL